VRSDCHYRGLLNDKLYMCVCVKGQTLTVDNTVCGTGVEEVDEVVVVLEVVGMSFVFGSEN
jgi:hypothetical protein